VKRSLFTTGLSVVIYSLIFIVIIAQLVLHCKKYFQDLLSQHIFFCQINSIIIYLVEITYYFEFLMIKLISIVLTHFVQFKQLKILRQPRLLTFFKLIQQYFLQCSNHNIFSFVKST